MKHKGLHIALFVVAVAVLALPAVQQHAKLFKLAPLKGVTVGAERPHLNPSTFLSGEYQRQEDQYLTENIGFRELFVRSYNQWSWSLFRQPQNKRVVLGKDGWLFSDLLTRHHDHQLIYDYGEHPEEVERRMEASAILLYQLQEVLREQGVSFFVCLTPSKDGICGEHMDDRERVYEQPSGVLAVDFFPPLFDSLGVNCLNLSEHYRQIKDTVSYPLYLKNSFHWSFRSACYVADTLLHYMEGLSGLNLHDLSYSEPYLAPTRYPDADLEELMNLLWSTGDRENYYVDVEVDQDTTAVKPRILIVGDSYYWVWHYGLPLDQLFETYHYWYYNHTIHNDPWHSDVSEVDPLRELLSTDIVMLLYSPTNLYDLNRGFLTNSLLAFYYDEGVVERKIEDIKEEIRNHPVWLSDVEEKALANGQELEQAIDEEAHYVLTNTPSSCFRELGEAKLPSGRSPRLDKVRSDLQDSLRVAYRNQVFKNQEWLNSLRGKADERGVSLDRAIEMDIDWLINSGN